MNVGEGMCTFCQCLSLTFVAAQARRLRLIGKADGAVTPVCFGFINRYIGLCQ